IGNLFLQVQDNAHALSEFEMALKSEPKNAAALAGAGRAAFELGHYAKAMPYLERAAAEAPGNANSAARLRIARLVLEMDPFRQERRVRDREQAVVNAFATAGKRLGTCSAAETSEEKQMLAQRWAGMNPQVTISHLRANPDLINSAMSLVFRIERETQDICGAGSDEDAALLLIARNHEGL
ncbi:MAG: tetratricopeptide repeat protein, partial [Acidobacteriota bacterium]